jgi:carboxylesterase
MSLRQKAPFGIKDERIRRFVLESLQSDGRPLQDVFGRRGGTVWEFKAMAGAARKLIGRISKPVLICHARQDDQSDLSNAFLLQRQLAGPVDVCILDDCYHMVTLDRQRTQVVDRTVAFADGLVLAQNSAGDGLSNTMQEPFSAVVSGPKSA